MTNIWTPLLDVDNTTRIFELLPGSGESKICLRLHPIILSYNRVGYEAISYTWGGNLITKSIEVDGKDYEIRQNLYQFLCILRQSSSSRFLWADAISIDQNNVDEKAHQVGIFDQIFAKADTVLVWLGSHADGSERIMDAFNQTHYKKKEDVTFRLFNCGMTLYRNRASELRDAILFTCSYPLRIVHNHRSPVAYPNVCVREAERLLTRSERDKFEKFLIELKAFYNRPYWGRTWIVQELKMAQKKVVYCGSSTASWAAVQALYSHISNGRVVYDEQFRTQVRLSTGGLFATTFDNSKLSMYTLVMVYGASTTCLNPRDKIYALLGITIARTRQQLKIDYKEDVIDLYFRILEFCWFHELTEDSKPDGPGQHYARDAIFWSHALAGALSLTLKEVEEGLDSRTELLKDMRVDKKGFLDIFTEFELRDQSMVPMQTDAIDWKAEKKRRKAAKSLSRQFAKLFPWKIWMLAQLLSFESISQERTLNRLDE